MWRLFFHNSYHSLGFLWENTFLDEESLLSLDVLHSQSSSCGFLLLSCLVHQSRMNTEEMGWFSKAPICLMSALQARGYHFENVSQLKYPHSSELMVPHSNCCDCVVPFQQPSSTVAVRDHQCGSDGVLQNWFNHPRNLFLECVWSIIFSCLLTMVTVKWPIHSTKHSWHCYPHS